MPRGGDRLPLSKLGFAWQETFRRLAELAEHHELVADERGSGYVALGSEGEVVAAFEPPALLPTHGRSAADYLRDADSPGRHLVLLLQAGRTAIGAWDDDELLAHKVITKYVVRGKGRAQPAFLRTRGKSRYGSRLRLQNARQQLVETNVRLIDYWQAHGPPRLIHCAVPVRTWPELWRIDPAPPFEQRDPRLCRVRFHVHPPSFDELQSVRRRLALGQVAWRG